MIRRVRVDGYKTLKRLDVRLGPLTVIFGPNAAGKSNFLDALQLLSQAATARTLKEAFDPPYRGTPLESFTFGAKGIPGHLEQEKLRFTLEVDVELSPSTIAGVERQIVEMRSGNGADPKRTTTIKERMLRYRLVIEILPTSGIVRVADEYLAALKADGDLKASRRPFIEKRANKLHLRLEGQAHPTYHELGLDHTLLSRPLYPPHYPHITAFRQELSEWAFFYFEPRERMRARNPVKEVRHIGLMGEELSSFLNTLKATDESQFRAVERALHSLVPRVTKIDVKPNAIGEVELNLVEDGIAIPARLVSEGTLRMLGMLAVASAREPSTLVAFEEPENGIHPRRITLLAEFLKGQSDTTQFIVTTHSAILPDLLPDDALFVCRRSEAGTIIEPFASVGVLYRQGDIATGLDDESEVPLKVSERIMRGDFDA